MRPLSRSSELRLVGRFAIITLSLALLSLPPLSRRAAAEASFPTADEEMVVRATRTQSIRSTIPASATIIEGTTLDTSISTNLADALRFTPSLQLTSEGARGGRSQLSLRGLDPNHVVVLIDGIRLNDPTNSRGGAFDPTTLALVDVERVEIVRGPLSTVYGSDALAGAVNIVTRRAGPTTEPEVSVRLRGGRFHFGQAIAQARTRLGSVAGLSLGAAIDTFRDPNADGGYDGANLKARIGIDLPFEVELDAFTRIHQGSARSFPESSGGPELATLRQLEDRDVREILFGVGLSREFGELARVDIRLGRASRRERLRSPGIDPDGMPGFNDVPPTRSGDEYERWELTLATAYQAPAFELAGTSFEVGGLVGGDAVWEDGESDSILDFSGAPFGGPVSGTFFDSRRTVGIFKELEVRIAETLTLSGSVRYDSTPDANDRFAPAAGASLDLPGLPIVLFGSYGEGFKRPSFFALGNPLVGNANLRREKSRGWELGLRARAFGGRLRGQVSYFDLRVRDLVDFDDTTFSLVQRGRLVSRGVELEMAWQPLDQLTLEAGGMFNYTNFAGGGGPEPENRPRWRGYLGIQVKPISSLSLSTRVLGVTSRKGASFQTGGRPTTLHGHVRVDVRAAYTPRPWVDLFVEIENLTNATPREAVGFETPGIAPRAGVTFRL